MLAAATGVLQLTVTVMVWGRAWTAVAAALAGAADVHWIAASLIAPAMARGQTGNQLRRIGPDAHARRTWPASGRPARQACGAGTLTVRKPWHLPGRSRPVCQAGAAASWLNRAVPPPSRRP